MVDRELYERTLREHTRLRDLGAEMIEFLERPRPEPDSPAAVEWASALHRRLCDVHASLSRQLRDEDEAGTLPRLAEAHPRWADQLDELRREQAELFEELRAIVSATMIYAENRQLPNPRLRAWTRGMLDAFTRHEQRETELILQLMNTDVGTGD